MNNKNLLKGTLVYSISSVLTKMGTLIFLPIMTRILTPKEFGIIGILNPITTIFTIILGLGIYNAQIKKYIELKDDKKEWGSYVFSVLITLMVFNLIVVAFLFTPLSEFLFSKFIDLSVVSYYPLVVVSIMIAVVNAFNTLAIAIFRMKKMFLRVALGSLLSFFSNYILAIYFIKYLKLGVLGNQLANLIAVSFLLIYSFTEYLKGINFKIKKDHIKSSIKNGFPLVFIELTDQVVNFSDRIILAHFVSYAAIGAYTLAYTGGRALSTITNSFVSSWIPEFYEKMAENSNDKSITESLEKFVSLMCFISIVAELFAPELIILLFPKHYSIAIRYMPIIFVTVVIQSFYALDYFFHFKEKSIYIFYLTFFSMIINIIGNLVFIPMFVENGVLVASITTLISFLLRVIIVMYVIYKKYDVKFNYKRLLMYLFSILNPIVFILANEHISIYKMIFKIIYILIILKFIVSKDIKNAVLSKIYKKFN